MRSIRRFGNAGDVPSLGLGTWQMERDGPQSVVEALRTGVELGMTHIDTAELYGSGRVEELVGEAISGKRDRIFLVSKVIPSNATRRGTVRACEASLKRLQTDRLDCYLLHWPGEHPLEETIAAFEELQHSGKIRAWGVSNFDADELDAALRIAGPGKIACNQVLYNLAQRDIEAKVVPWCEAVVRGTRRGRRGVHAVRVEVSAQGFRRSGTARGGGAARCQPASGGARLPHSKAESVRHSQGVQRGARAREREGRPAAARRSRSRRARRSIPRAEANEGRADAVISSGVTAYWHVR